MGPGVGATDTVRAHPELPRERTYTCGVTGSLDTPWRGGRGHAVEDLSTRALSTKGRICLEPGEGKQSHLGPSAVQTRPAWDQSQ